MNKARLVVSVFSVLMCLLKIASLRHVEDADSMFDYARNSSTIKDSALLKTEVNNSESTRQIMMKQNPPEFWPLSSDHSVQNFCTAQQNRTNKVQKENKGHYCDDTSLAEPVRKPLGEPVIITTPDLYRNSNFSTSWYKNCKEYVKNTSEVSFTSLQQSDSAVYTYIITHMYNGEKSGVCGKKWLIVEEKKKQNRIAKPTVPKAHRENIKPRILGIGNITITEVEIGQNHSLKCEAFVGDFGLLTDLYWLRIIGDNNSEVLDDCNLIKNKPCMGTIDDTGPIWISELHIINISNDDIKYQYKCQLNSVTTNSEVRLFVMKLKDKSQDISTIVFTASIISSIICVVAILVLVGMCILFRIQIVLLYRSISGVDETIGDGKQYDAYLSLESFSTFESDERRFALQTLAPVLEDYFGYTLFIFDRDVVPGGALVDDMNSFLEKSRRLIIVLGNDFTSCKAMYELESGLYKAMVERKIKVILIEFTILNEQNFQPESLQLLKMKSRVKWKGDESHPLNSSFWKKIQYLMPAKPMKPSSSSLALKTIQADNNRGILILNSS
ncbi:interleukin-18 receptor 1-like [Anomaloglossus baeobatrachus]|uniref:interleukin-18 receptor 1-like n=1 Tax=Anomaloglossus baeobatrachus TaxID=238106 RepID=UPI003F503EEC